MKRKKINAEVLAEGEAKAAKEKEVAAAKLQRQKDAAQKEA